MAMEAASTAAAQALAELKNQRQDEKSWYKTLPKPGVYYPKSREEELSMWRDFVWSLQQYLASFDIEYLADFEALRKNPSTEADISLMGDKEKSRSSFQNSLFPGLLKNRPLLVLRQGTGSYGFEACRQFLSSLEPVSRNRSLGILNSILGWSSLDMQKNMLSQLVKIEDAFREYEKTGAKLAEEIKFARIHQLCHFERESPRV